MVLHAKLVGNVDILGNQGVSKSGRTTAEKIGMGQQKAWNHS